MSLPLPVLCRIILRVRDPVALSGWYHEAFGWAITVDERVEEWIELDAGGGMSVALHGGGRGKVGHWPKLQVRVDQVAAARDALIARGVPMGPIQHWKHLEWAEGADPEGHVFQIANR